MFTVLSTADGAEHVVRTIADAFDAVERIAAARNMFGGHDIHGTHAIAYHDGDYEGECISNASGCGGHEVARVFDTRNMNATTAATLAGMPGRDA